MLSFHPFHSVVVICILLYGKLLVDLLWMGFAFMQLQLMERSVTENSFIFMNQNQCYHSRWKMSSVVNITLSTSSVTHSIFWRQLENCLASGKRDLWVSCFHVACGILSIHKCSCCSLHNAKGNASVGNMSWSSMKGSSVQPKIHQDCQLFQSWLLNMSS